MVMMKAYAGRPWNSPQMRNFEPEWVGMLVHFWKRPFPFIQL